MARYVAMIPPAGGPDKALLLRDGFAWAGFILPAFWLLWHRLWIEALLVFAVTLGLGTAGEALGTPGAGWALSLLVSLAVGLEGRNWRFLALLRRGWREAGTVEAHDADEADARFFAGLAESEPARDAPSAQPPGRAARRAAPAPLGLLGYRG